MTTTLAPNVGALKQRDTLRLCTAGSVDDGKSTFVGRLLYDTKSVLADQVESMERSSADRGFDGMDLSLLVDGLRAEREQGITIDVAYRYFATDKRTFILADRRHLCTVPDDDSAGRCDGTVISRANACAFIVTSRSHPSVAADDDGAGYVAILTGADTGAAFFTPRGYLRVAANRNRPGHLALLGVIC